MLPELEPRAIRQRFIVPCSRVHRSSRSMSAAVCLASTRQYSHIFQHISMRQTRHESDSGIQHAAVIRRKFWEKTVILSGLATSMPATQNSAHQRSRELYSTATRTLLASGYVITSTDPHPTHIEFDCERPSRLGAMLRFRVGFTAENQFDSTTLKAMRQTADSAARAAIFVSLKGGDGQVSWTEFLNVLGGAVPSWRALSNEYPAALATAARNKIPKGMSGEAWAIFEDLVADGLEFCFGRKVGRFGGRRRGLRVSDMIAQLPDSSLIVVDAKAYEGGIDVKWPALRPLVEYVQLQKQYQQERNEVVAALIVSSKFQRDKSALAKPASNFLGETRVPLCFITAKTLAGIVSIITHMPDFRNSISWKFLFTGGLIDVPSFRKQLNRVKTERFEPGVD